MVSSMTPEEARLVAIKLSQGLHNKNLMIDAVHKKLQKREIHPRGEWHGRKFYANTLYFSVRSPSNKFPYSQMVHCRTKKHVTAVYEDHLPKTQTELEKLV